MERLRGLLNDPCEYRLARRRTYLRIDLDTLTRNVQILKSLCSTNTEFIAVVKGNAYGHGAVEIARHLESNGVKHFAVASPWEGMELRQAGVTADIQILGNACEEEIPDLVEFDMIPTTGSIEFLRAWALYTQHCACPEYILSSSYEDQSRRPVIIKVDTGMSRNGCRPEDLDFIMQTCEELAVPVHSIMTHFAAAWDNDEFTRGQLDSFLKVASKYRSQGIKLHCANSAGTLLGYGTDLDYVRPGVAMYGQPPDTTEYAIDMYKRLGLKPILSWRARPNLVKVMSEGKTVGYDNTYRCSEGEVIATMSFGYADGYNRLLSGKGVITSEHDEQCPIIGRVSMDAVAVRLPDNASDNLKPRDYYVIKDDYTSPNSVVELAKQLKTITYEVTTSLATRMARVYATGGDVFLGKT